jgi:hypothetical protein
MHTRAPSPGTLAERAGLLSPIRVCAWVVRVRNVPPRIKNEPLRVLPQLQHVGRDIPRARDVAAHAKAARLLGMERNRLYRVMKGLGMKVPEE